MTNYKVNVTNMRKILKVYNCYRKSDPRAIYSKPIVFDDCLWIVNGVAATCLSSEFIPINNEFDFVYAEDLEPEYYNAVKNMTEYIKEKTRNAAGADSYRVEWIDRKTLKAAIQIEKNKNKYNTPTVKLGETYVNAQYLLDNAGIINRKTVCLLIGGRIDPVIIGHRDGAITMLMPLNLTEKTTKYNGFSVIELDSIYAYNR